MDFVWDSCVCVCVLCLGVRLYSIPLFMYLKSWHNARYMRLASMRSNLCVQILLFTRTGNLYLFKWLMNARELGSIVQLWNSKKTLHLPSSTFLEFVHRTWHPKRLLNWGSLQLSHQWPASGHTGFRAPL